MFFPSSLIGVWPDSQNESSEAALFCFRRVVAELPLNFMVQYLGIGTLINVMPNCQLGTYLVVHEYVHDVLVDLPSQPVLWPPGENDKLNSQQGNQDQGGSHCLHVHVGLCPMCVSQLGYQHSYNI